MKPRLELKPSAYVMHFAKDLIECAADFPIADIGCGSGRNAFFILQLGHRVLCIDKDVSLLRTEELHPGMRKNLQILSLDVLKEAWPFAPASLGGVILVDFLPWALLPIFAESLIPNGRLLLETVSGRGGNFRELPKAGQVKAIFKTRLVIDDYREKLVGPAGNGAVTVKMIGRRLSAASAT